MQTTQFKKAHMTRSDLDGLNLYHKTLLVYYEEEIMGEAYFNGLARLYANAGAREKLILLAQVERRAAEAMEPLLRKYDLKPRKETVLLELGTAQAEKEKRSWPEFVEYMIKRFPAYIDDFEGLERLAPKVDLPPLKVLTEHEVVAIEFAEKEFSGDEDSTAPLHRYLEMDLV